LTRQHL